MLPRSHFLFGIVTSLFIYILFPTIGILNLIIFFGASILIDVDHYLYYVYKKRDWNLLSAIKWFMDYRKNSGNIGTKQEHEPYDVFFFLHGFEILILFGILGLFVSRIFYFACLGFALHLILDYIKSIMDRNRFGKFSIIWSYINYKKFASFRKTID